jgi:hypothetical protein
VKAWGSASDIDQKTDTVPVDVENTLYFVALVASSWIAMDRHG